MIQHYSFNIQQAFAHDFLAEIGYLGTRGTHLFRQRSANQALDATPSNPVRGETTDTLANLPLRVPLVGWDPQNLTVIESEGASWFNALESSLSKRFTHGLQFLASYTWSRSLSTDLNSTTGVNGGQSLGNQNDPRARYGPDSFVRPHRFVVSYLYQIPGPKNPNSFLGETLGGWMLSGVTTVQAGHYLSITELNPTNAFGIVQDLGQFGPGCSNADIATHGSVQSRLNGYINATCVVPQPVIGADAVATGFGNMHPGILRGPDQVNTDFAVSKRFAMRWPSEGANVEFRTELFNAFNHPQFADPDLEATSATFGQIQSTAVAPRVMQLALKINF